MIVRRRVNMGMCETAAQSTSTCTANLASQTSNQHLQGFLPQILKSSNPKELSLLFLSSLDLWNTQSSPPLGPTYESNGIRLAPSFFLHLSCRDIQITQRRQSLGSCRRHFQSSNIFNSAPSTSTPVTLTEIFNMVVFCEFHCFTSLPSHIQDKIWTFAALTRGPISLNSSVTPH